MKLGVRVATVFAACVFLSACAAARPVADKDKGDPRPLSVRLPIADAATLNVESQTTSGHPELPPSVADESRGRWLKFFEVDYSPPKPPPPPGEEEPSR